jgi:hypothetical protein
MSKVEQLQEFPNVGQVRDEPRRRWFYAKGLDLIVWLDDTDKPFKFQLCYEKGRSEFALTWETEKGFDHASVDAGEGTAFESNTPILRVDGDLDPEFLLALFENSSREVPTDIRSLVAGALRLYPRSPKAPGRRPFIRKVNREETD